MNRNKFLRYCEPVDYYALTEADLKKSRHFEPLDFHIKPVFDLVLKYPGWMYWTDGHHWQVEVITCHIRVGAKSKNEAERKATAYLDHVFSERK